MKRFGRNLKIWKVGRIGALGVAVAVSFWGAPVAALSAQSAAQRFGQEQQMRFDPAQDGVDLATMFEWIRQGRLDVAQLSDEQIERVARELRRRGISVSQVRALAQVQGVSSAQASLLARRLQQVGAGAGRSQGVEAAPDEALRSPLPGESSPTQLRQVQQWGNGSAEASATEPREAEPRMEADAARDEGAAAAAATVFGRNLFGAGAMDFAPSFNIPTPVDYALGPGDELIVDIWGASEASLRLTVTTEGVVRVPNLGPVQVNGLTIEAARERLLRRLGAIYSGLRSQPDRPADTFADVSLGNVRSIRVTVVGEARQPGSYSLSSLSTLYNALFASGGPNEIGSLRRVDLLRGGQVAASLDLYEFLLDGELSGNERLRDQDIIRVNPRGGQVGIQGRVIRPGIYEMAEGETMEDLLAMAGGFEADAYRERLTLRRFTGVQREMADVEWAELGGVELRDGDVVEVGKVLDRYANRVSIQGAVFRQGEFELTPGMGVRDLVARADGVREDAFMDRAALFRLDETREAEVLQVPLREILSGEGPDIPLRPDDLLLVRSRFEMNEAFTVAVRGEVNAPGEFAFAENLTVEDAILLASGFKDNAASYRVEVARRVRAGDSTRVGNRIARVLSVRVDRDLRVVDEQGAPVAVVLEPYDQVFVRRSPNYFEQRSIRVEGEVAFPGEYVLDRRDVRISQVLERAGGLTQMAYPEGATLTRRPGAVEQGQEARLRDLSLDGELSLQTGRSQIGIRLEEVLRRPGGEEDLFLQPGDVLQVPAELQTVRVEGQVLYPVSMRYEQGMGVRDVIDRVGGLAEDADARRIYVVYANGEVDRSRRVLFATRYPKVTPGSTVYFPAKPPRDELTTQERLAVVSAVVSMAAIVTNSILYARR